MTETDFTDWLADLMAETDDPMVPVDSQTFADAGVLTNNSGLVVRVGDAEFQVTVVRSR